MKKTKLLSLFALLLVVFSCSKDDAQAPEINPTAIDQKDVLSVDEINARIQEAMETSGTFDWKTADDHMLWSAVVHGNNILTVGYGDQSFSMTKSQSLTKIKDEILLSISTSEQQKSTGGILIHDDDILNLIDVKVTTLEAITALRKNQNIRYLEPEGYAYEVATQKSSSGCNQSGQSIAAADYGTLSSGAKVPWNYYDHNVDDAWAYSTGRGIGVGVIDTGLSANQPNLGYKFDDFYGGRYVQKYGTYVDSWWPWSSRTDGPNDKCGHGTSACATVAAPNNNIGQFIGVAYECNLVSYRGTSDVVLNGYHERKGVANALKALGNRGDIKIISMSIGYPWSIGRIADAVRYAHARGKLIFAAGGTSTSFTNWYGIIFPASMNETVAVTGVEERAGYEECDTCHIGDMDFTIIMERGNNNHQPVVGFNNGQSQYFGGSSVATAFAAGVAALVWSEYPSWNRDQVLQRLKEASALYPNKNSNFGYGNIDALKAVSGNGI